MNEAQRARAVSRGTAGYMGTKARLRAEVIRRVKALWAGAPNLRDADMAILLPKLVLAVEAGQLQAANITSAYLAQQAFLLRGVPPVAAPVDRRAIVDVRGVPTAELLNRSAVAVYAALKAGKAFPEAKAAGLTRLLSVTSTQLQLASTYQAQASLTASGAVYFKRTLSGSENCKICVLASTQRYSVIRRSAIHPGCDCGVAEMAPGEAPEKIIDRALLDSVSELKDADGKTLDPKDLITIHEHGELGPVLTWRKHEFTGPAALEDL